MHKILERIRKTPLPLCLRHGIFKQQWLPSLNISKQHELENCLKLFILQIPHL